MGKTDPHMKFATVCSTFNYQETSRQDFLQIIDWIVNCSIKFTNNMFFLLTGYARKCSIWEKPGERLF